MSGNEKKYIDQAFASNWIAPVGPNLDAFENEFCNKIGSKYSVAVSSGTAALHLALRVLDVGEGDIVFCSNFTFIASVTPILFQQAIPVLIDSDTESWNMSPALLAKALQDACRESKLPKAIVVVGLYGQSPDMRSILGLANQYNIPVIEDSAESLGSKFNDSFSGVMGTIGIFSFNGNKIITGSGGGILASGNAKYIEKARKLSTQAREPVLHYEHKELGYNYRMSNIIAGVCRGQLEVLDDRVKARREIFSKYSQILKEIDGLCWMPEPDWSYSSRWLSCFTFSSDKYKFDPRQLISFLSEQSIEARPLWKPLHLQPILSGVSVYDQRSDASGKSLSEELYDSGVCLPSGSNMSDEDIERVAKLVKRFFGRGI